MKKLLFTLIVSLTICLVSNGNSETIAGENTHKETIKVVCSSDLFDLANNWKNKYSELNTQLEIKLVKINQDQLSNMQDDGDDLFLVSGENRSEFSLEKSWKMAIGRDIVVPVINAANPFIDQIYSKGISSDILAQTFGEKSKQSWNKLLGVNSDLPVRYFVLNNTSTQTILFNYLNIEDPDIINSKLVNSQQLISEIQNDPYAIGFCRLIDIVDPETQGFVENIRILPIDRNGNKKLDFFEDIYANPYSFKRGVWIGKYPKTLVSNVYALCNAKPINNSKSGFLNWILTDGQNFLTNNGISELTIHERRSNIEKLKDVNYTEITETSYAQNKNIFLVIIAFIAAGILLGAALQFRRNNKKEAGSATDQFFHGINENTLDLPSGLYYDKSYTWSFMEKDGSVKMGIDDFMQHITGPITQLKIKEPGDKIKKGQQILTLIQDGKQLNIYAPISGKITSVNDYVMHNSSLVNYSPYEKGWIYKIEPLNWSAEIQFLKMAGIYKDWLKNEFKGSRIFFLFTQIIKQMNLPVWHFRMAGR